MSKKTQDMRFKKAAIRHKTSRQNIYRWYKKYDGTVIDLDAYSQAL